MWGGANLHFFNLFAFRNILSVQWLNIPLFNSLVFPIRDNLKVKKKTALYCLSLPYRAGFGGGKPISYSALYILKTLTCRYVGLVKYYWNIAIYRLFSLLVRQKNNVRLTSSLLENTTGALKGLKDTAMAFFFFFFYSLLWVRICFLSRNTLRFYMFHASGP